MENLRRLRTLSIVMLVLVITGLLMEKLLEPAVLRTVEPLSNIKLGRGAI